MNARATTRLQGAGSWRRGSMSVLAAGASAALVLGLTACASSSPGDATSPGSASASSGSSASAASAASRTSAADITAAAKTSSTHVEALRTTVSGWASPCTSTGASESFLAAAQGALAKGQVSGARWLLMASQVNLENNLKRHLVSQAHYDAYAAEMKAIVAELPPRGKVTSASSFPVPPQVQRCAGQSQASTPKVALAAAAGDWTPNTPSDSETVHTAVEVAIAASPAVIKAFFPEAEVPEVALAAISGLVGLFWPSSEPEPGVTWDAMTTYVDNQISSAIAGLDKKIEDILDANQLATMKANLASLKTALDNYDYAMATLVPDATTYSGYSTLSTSEARTQRDIVLNDYTNLIPVFTTLPKSYLNLPETINLYTLYMMSLRGWILSGKVFAENACQQAQMTARFEMLLGGSASATKAAAAATSAASSASPCVIPSQKPEPGAISAATSIVTTQQPLLEATMPKATVAIYAPFQDGWNRHAKFMFALAGAGYDQVFDWQYLDPATNPPKDAATGTGANLPANTTLVTTPCLGGYAVTDRSGGMVPGDPGDDITSEMTTGADPTKYGPLTIQKFWGIPNAILGVQSMWAGSPSTLGLPGLGIMWGQGSPTPTATVSMGPSSDGWATEADLSWSDIFIPSAGTVNGGANKIKLVLTKYDANGNETSTPGSWIPSDTGIAQFYSEQNYSLPGYVVAWIGLAGADDARCMSVGFRLKDSY